MQRSSVTLEFRKFPLHNSKKQNIGTMERERHNLEYGETVMYIILDRAMPPV